MNDSMKNKCKDNFAVLSGRNNSFDWKKLLFHAGGTFVSTRRNFCFMLVELLFRLEETFVSCWWNFYFDWKKLLFSAGGTFVYSA